MEGPDGVHRGRESRFVVTGPGRYKARAMEPEAGYVVVTGSLAPTHANGYAWKGYFSGHPDTRHYWYADGRHLKDRETSFDLVARLPDEKEGCTDYCVGHGQHSPYCPNFRSPADAKSTQVVTPLERLEAWVQASNDRSFSIHRHYNGFMVQLTVGLVDPGLGKKYEAIHITIADAVTAALDGMDRMDRMAREKGVRP